VTKNDFYISFTAILDFDL